jgi:hypothetical protein
MKQQLPESIHRLVDNVELVVSETEVIWCLARQQPIHLASDGRAYRGRASFGWILLISDTQVAKGKGPVYGDDPQSFQADGFMEWQVHWSI